MKNFIADFLLSIADKMTGKSNIVADNNGIKDFNRAVFKKNARDFTILFCGCFALILGCMFFIPKITSSDNDVAKADAKSQSVVKFAKEGTSNNNLEDENVSALVGNINDGDLKSNDDIPANNIAYKTITLGGNQETEDNNENNNSRTLNDNKTYTNCLANIRASASDDSDVIGEADYGSEIEIVGEENEYYKIKWGVDGFGFIHKACIDNE